MATQAQILANRQNSLKSTGPRSPEGKAATAQNAFQSGLDAEAPFCPGESREAFARLQSEYFDRFQPSGPDERFQLDTMIRNEWLLRRLFRAEAQLWDYYATSAGDGAAAPLGQALAENSTVFNRLQRRVSAAERSYKEARRELDRLQSARPAEPLPQDLAQEIADVLSDAPQPQPNTPTSPKLASFLKKPEAALGPPATRL